MRKNRTKQILELFKNEFIYGGHMISLGSVSTVFVSAIILGIKVTWEFLLVVYLEAQAVYWYYQIQDIEYDFLTNSQRCSHIKKYIKTIPYLIAIFIIILIAILLYFSKFFILLLFLLHFLTSISYNNFFKLLTRKIIGFKNLFISFGESFLILLLIVYYSFPFNFSFLLLFTFIYFRWIVNTVFLDTKDIEIDKRRNLLTFAIVLKEKLIIFLKILSLLAILPILFGVLLGILPKFSLMLFLTVPYTFYYLDTFKKRNNSIYYIVSDGEFMLWTLFIIFGALIFKT